MLTAKLAESYVLSLLYIHPCLMNHCEIWSHFSLTAELQSKFRVEFISFTHSLLLGLIITDAMALVLEFQCLMHPAVAIHSLPEFDGVKHNEKDDLMDFNLDCHWKKILQFSLPRAIPTELLFLLPEASGKKRDKGMHSVPAVST